LDWPVRQDVVKDEFRDEELVAAHFAGDTALQLNRFVVIHVVEMLQDLQNESIFQLSTIITLILSSANFEIQDQTI